MYVSINRDRCTCKEILIVQVKRCSVGSSMYKMAWEEVLLIALSKFSKIDIAHTTF